jgi:hypothetical protein
MHITSWSVPWISTIDCGETPAFWCSPSTFCVISVSSGRAARARRARGVPDWLAAVDVHLDPHPPRALAHLGIGHVMADRRHLLGLGILGPQPLRPAEVGIPESVEMPAAVSTTIRRAPSIQPRTAAIAAS